MADLWIQVETGLASSALVDRAHQELGVSINEAIGLLVRLWLGVMRAGCGGDLSERSAEWIEQEGGWRGERGKFAAFIRARHLVDGVIPDWREKYGKLEDSRAAAAALKRNQRARYRREEQGRPTVGTVRPVDSPVDRQVDGQSDSSPISNLISQSDLSPSKVLEESVKRDTPGIERFLTAWDFGRWSLVVEAYLRNSLRPMNVMAELELWLTGEAGRKKQPPDVIGLALNQYAASPAGAEGFKPNLFGGFVRNAVRGISRNENHFRNAAEEAHLIQERRQREEREQEQRDSDMLNDFANRHEERSVLLKQQAEASVDKRYKGDTRAEMVRGALIGLVRKEATKAT